MIANRKKLSLAAALTVGLLGLAAMGGAIAGHAGHAGHGKMMLKMADANGDGVATVTEAQALIAQHAQAMDADKNGLISIDEMEAHRAQMRAERRAARFARFDADKNGSVSVAEFSAAQTARIGSLDANKDGVIDRNDHPQRGERQGHGPEHHAQ